MLGSVLLLSILALAANPAARAYQDKAKDKGPQGPPEPKLIVQDDDDLPQGALARVGTVRLRHGSVVTSLAYSKDGKTLASGSWDTTIRFWDPANGVEKRVISAARTKVVTIALSADGKTLASAGWDNVIRLWDATSGVESQVLGGHARWVLSVAFSPNGKLLASGSQDRTVRLWDIEGGKNVTIWTGHTGEVRAVAFSKNGKILASASEDGTVRLWDVPGKTELAKLDGHKGGAGSVAFAPDGKLLATGGADKIIRLWDVADKKEVRRFEGHEGYVSSIAFSPDGKLLASATGYPVMDRTARIWNVETGKQLHKLRSEYFGSVAFAPDGKTLAVAPGDATIHLYDPKTGKEFETSARRTVRSQCVARSPDGKLLAVAGMELFLLDAATGKEIRGLDGPAKGSYGAAFSPDGCTLATGGRDGVIRLWNVANGKEIGQLDGHKGQKPDQGWINCVAYSPNGKLLAEASRDGSVQLWDVDKKQLVRRLLGHDGVVWSVAFSADSKRVVSGGLDKSVRIWDADSGNIVSALTGHTSEVEGVAWSPDGRLVASGGRDGTARIWSAASGKQLHELREPSWWNIRAGHHRDGKTLAFSPDGRLLAWGTWRSVHIWETETGRERAYFVGHRGEVNALAFSPNGRVLTTGSFDGAVIIWDVTGRSPKGTLTTADLSEADAAKEWKKLLATDAALAHKAIWTLVAAPKQALALLKANLKATAPTDEKRIAKLIVQLDDDDFDKRDKASEELAKFGSAAGPALRKALEGKVSAEVRLSAQRLLDMMEKSGSSAEEVRTIRALELLEQLGTPEARTLLQTLAKGAPNADLTREAKAILDRLERRRAE
jgi:WD40 repeat protein